MFQVPFLAISWKLGAFNLCEDNFWHGMSCTGINLKMSNHRLSNSMISFSNSGYEYLCKYCWNVQHWIVCPEFDVNRAPTALIVYLTSGILRITCSGAVYGPLYCCTTESHDQLYSSALTPNQGHPLHGSVHRLQCKSTLLSCYKVT